MKRVRIEGGLFAAAGKAKPGRVRLDKSHLRQGIPADALKRVSLTIREVSEDHPRELKGASAKIVYGEITGYTPVKKRPYIPGAPEEVLLDMLWLINNSHHMYWTSVMLAGAEAIKELLEQINEMREGK